MSADACTSSRTLGSGSVQETGSSAVVRSMTKNFRVTSGRNLAFTGFGATAQGRHVLGRCQCLAGVDEPVGDIVRKPPQFEAVRVALTADVRRGVDRDDSSRVSSWSRDTTTSAG